MVLPFGPRIVVKSQNHGVKFSRSEGMRGGAFLGGLLILEQKKLTKDSQNVATEELLGGSMTHSPIF